MINNIQNPGSALGEAIGAEMEKALNSFLTVLVESQGNHFLSKSPVQNKNGIFKKLLMYDNFGTAYNVDAVIANESMQPIVLIESKYIRYKKHNRDKGSWICTAHPAIRRRYQSIRSSIAVLAGNWSSSSLTMLKSFDINIFLIPFSKNCELLAVHYIHFDWSEKEREIAQDAWQKYSALTMTQKSKIGEGMIQPIKKELEELVLNILDNTRPRSLRNIVIELHSTLGEVKAYQFSEIEQAITFLNEINLQEAFISKDSLTLFEPPPMSEDD